MEKEKMLRDIEQTREKVGIHELDTAERKKLFRKFSKHGGKVVDQDDKKPKSQIVRKKPSKKQKKIKQKYENRQISLKEKQTLKKPLQEIEPGIDKEVIKRLEKKNRIADLIKIRLKGFQHKIFTIGGNRFTNKFIKSIKKSVRERFVELSISLNSILTGEVAVINDIRRMSTGKNSTFYEVLVRLNALYDEKEYLIVSKVISNKIIPEKSGLEIFKQFFKKIYILGQFRSICKMCVEKAVVIHGKNNKIHPDVIISVIDQLKEDIDILLGDFFNKFHIILCKIDRTYYPLYSQELDNFLDITEKDRIGYITLIEKKKRMEQLKKEQESLKKKQYEKEREEQEIKIPKHVKRGLPLVREAMEKYEKLYGNDKDNPFRLMDKDDIMYKTFILLDIFNNEYSFILTTGKISFNIDYREQKKINIKEDLGNAYLLLNAGWESVKEYLEIIKEIDDMHGNFRYTAYQQSVMLKTLEKKQSVSRSNTRRKIANVMKTIEDILVAVIMDYNSHKLLLQNPEEILYFDKHVEREKEVHEKKVIEAIMEAFLFSATFTFLFNFSELSGRELF
ncbi:hypothetical protein ES703_70693 [subsurface metagenome]